MLNQYKGPKIAAEMDIHKMRAYYCRGKIK